MRPGPSTYEEPRSCSYLEHSPTATSTSSSVDRPVADSRSEGFSGGTLMTTTAPKHPKMKIDRKIGSLVKRFMSAYSWSDGVQPQQEQWLRELIFRAVGTASPRTCESELPSPLRFTAEFNVALLEISIKSLEPLEDNLTSPPP